MRINTKSVKKDYESSYWAFACKLDINYLSWVSFRKEYLKRGGDKYYGAWQLTYNEPLFRARLFGKRSQFIQEKYDIFCPNAENLQPRIMQFKTNYFDISEVKRQAEVLLSTLEYFN